MRSRYAGEGHVAKSLQWSEVTEAVQADEYMRLPARQSSRRRLKLQICVGIVTQTIRRLRKMTGSIYDRLEAKS